MATTSSEAMVNTGYAAPDFLRGQAKALEDSDRFCVARDRVQDWPEECDSVEVCRGRAHVTADGCDALCMAAPKVRVDAGVVHEFDQGAAG